MKIWLTIIGVLLVYSAMALAWDDDDDDDEDSSEYGVVDGEKGTSCTCGTANKEGERIVGGKEAKKNEWPMMAEFSMNGNHFCGGTLISKRHVITAAHCGFYPKSSKEIPYDKIDVYLGAHEISGEKAFQGAQKFAIQKFKAHPKYDYAELKYDIAIVLLDREADSQNGNVVPACFPLRADYKNNDQVVTLGWGKLKHSHQIAADVLMKVKLNIVDNEKCKSRFRRYHEDSQICMYGKKKDPCEGDSGGPHLYRDVETNRYTLVGVTSYGKRCGASVPGINANVVLLKDWLLETISETDPDQNVCTKVD